MATWLFLWLPLAQTHQTSRCPCDVTGFVVLTPGVTCSDVAVWRYKTDPMFSRDLGRVQNPRCAEGASGGPLCGAALPVLSEVLWLIPAKDAGMGAGTKFPWETALRSRSLSKLSHPDPGPSCRIPLQQRLLLGLGDVGTH
ncbi:unnamed protein product [Rangifer tarandus platyrhynchus]|uniref:Uncharacterized protein n=1 Tax=Rangifer tarandus platyrhynchus TaxID=3082113 RepID=A0AC59Z3N2_RANTA